MHIQTKPMADPKKPLPAKFMLFMFNASQRETIYFSIAQIWTGSKIFGRVLVARRLLRKQLFFLNKIRTD